MEANAVADTLAERGHLLARVDSVRADTAFVTAGPVAVVGALDVVGAAALDPAAGWRTRPGEPFRPAAFRADLEATAARYAQTGRLAVRIVPAVTVADGGASVDVTVQVDEGPVSQIVGVELAGARGTGRAFASRRAGVTGPTDPAGLDRQRVRAALEATGLYESVGEPILALDDAGELVVQVPVVEAPPGVVDAVVGYLPPAGGAGGGVVGRGRVDVRSPFGGGRTGSVEVERTPGLASALAASLSDPFLFGTPFGVGLSFAGATRDSTLSRQRFGAEVRYALDRGLDVVATVASEAVRPGRFGSSEVDGRPRVRRTDDVLVGLGLDLRRLDRPRNPRRGAALFVVVEQGRRAGDALDGARGRRRLGVESRVFLATFARQSLVLGLDATVTQQTAGGLVDEGDLVRLGGAASFRGYDEDAFLARSFARGLAEYRFLFDETSFAFAFADAGGFDRPATPGLAAETRGLVGYGAGLRVQTAIGLATVTYALNPDLGATDGKIHVGLTVGL